MTVKEAFGPFKQREREEIPTLKPSIRRFCPKDAYAYCRLKQLSWQHTLKIIYPDKYSYLPAGTLETLTTVKYFNAARAREIEANLEQQDDFQHAFVMRRRMDKEERIIGIMLLNVTGLGSGEILELDIFPEFRGHKFGTLFMQYAYLYFLKLGIPQISVELFECNHRAKLFYLRNGFDDFERSSWQVDSDITIPLLKVHTNLIDRFQNHPQLFGNLVSILHRIQSFGPLDLQTSA